MARGAGRNLRSVICSRNPVHSGLRDLEEEMALVFGRQVIEVLIHVGTWVYTLFLRGEHANV
jgi:hypothetical protein